MVRFWSNQRCHWDQAEIGNVDGAISVAAVIVKLNMLFMYSSFIFQEKYNEHFLCQFVTVIRSLLVVFNLQCIVSTCFLLLLLLFFLHFFSMFAFHQYQ